jgi:enamine deaminase RidA (YjgF/YER057c/UK114 family)
MSVDERLKAQGIELPISAAAAGNYIPFVINGDTVYISGQIPVVAGEVRGCKFRCTLSILCVKWLL